MSSVEPTLNGTNSFLMNSYGIFFQIPDLQANNISRFNPFNRNTAWTHRSCTVWRLIDHIQLVVRDPAAARAFYTAIFNVLNILIGGSGNDFFWADELFVSTPKAVLRNAP